MNSSQKNSDQTTQQPIFIFLFRDQIKNSTVSNFHIFLSKIDKNLVKNTENVNKNRNYSQKFKLR